MIAAWLGIIALSLDALVPVHFAFDLAEAVPSAIHRPAVAEHDPSRRLFALMTGHRDGDRHAADHSGDNGKDRHSRHECAVCASFGTLVGFAPAAVFQMPVPARVVSLRLLAVVAKTPHAALTLAYHSRAPPFGFAFPTA